ncbi:hypothetical protein, variant [Verruconis gallopava]|nr:hypothetical protein, variant [Verruconis gallopava]KIW08788.1 hypothetical protein, variant [Verruconis gallopava]
MEIDARERLRQHFLNNRSPERWDELWKDGSFLPWDRGTPNPALIDTLDSKWSTIGPALKQDGSRRKALVPGCGKGYDVYLFAAYGFDAFGLEVGNAVEAAKKFAPEADTRDEYKARDENVGKGKVEFVQGDFYAKDWETSCHLDGNSGFDVIYDYTFLCAMPPNLRPAWSKRMTELLAPGGTLICLEFPLYKEASLGGPPWAMRAETYEMLLPFPGEEPEYDENGYVIKQERPPNPNGLTRIARWHAERSHPVGQGTDHVSLWKHREAA